MATTRWWETGASASPAAGAGAWASRGRSTTTQTSWWTIILIAHRITTVRECDRIYLLEAGEITARGGYEELFAASERFRGLAKAGTS